MRFGVTTPSREEFAALDQAVVPVTRRLLADSETAVGSSRWKQVRSPVWQAAPSWSTSTSSASPSQSSRTPRTHCRLPDVSPLTQYSARLRDQ